MTKRPSAANNDPGYFYNQKRLLKIFTFASLALFIGILLMIWKDFDRPWKDDQRAFMRWDARKLALEGMILETRSQEASAQFSEMRAKAFETIAAKQEVIDALEADISDAKGARYDADIRYKEQKQYTLQAMYHVHEAQSEAERRSWKRKLEKAQDKEFRLRDNFQIADKLLATKIAERKAIDSELNKIVAAERKNNDLKRLALVAAGIEKKRGYNPLREIPLLDFLAPPTKVEQIVLKNLVDNYEFSFPNKVDRCGTCHIGTMTVGYDHDRFPIESLQEGNPVAFEEGVYRFVFGILENVESKDFAASSPHARELGQQYRVDVHHKALDLMYADYDPDSGEIGMHKDGPEQGRKIWRKWKRDQDGKWITAEDGHSVAEYYKTLLAQMKPHWRTHPHFDDMVGPTSPHPYEKFGCSGCHQGRGWSTDFGYAWHSPDRIKTDDWMTTAGAEKKGKHLPLSAATSLEEAMATGTSSVALTEAEQQAHVGTLSTGFVTDKKQKQRWADELGRNKNKLKYWIWPQHPKTLVQASCMKCHKEGLYETPEEEYGKTRIGKPDPDLPDTFDWEDHAFVANRAAAAEATNRVFIPADKPAYRPENLERGLDNFQRFGCYGCHKLDPERYPFMKNVRPKVGPPLDELASKTSEAWALKWVHNPKDFRPNTRMPRFFGLSNSSHKFRYLFAEDGYREVDGVAWGKTEAAAITKWMFAESRTRSRDLSDVKWQGGDAKRGERIIVGDYHKTEGLAKACIACHDVPVVTEELELKAAAMKSWTDPLTGKVRGWDKRMSRRQGPNLAGIGSKLNAAWLFTWLKDPRGYWHDTNMPDLRLDDQEARDVVAYLMTLKHEAFDAIDRTDPVTMDRGLLLAMAKEQRVGEQRESTDAAIAAIQNMEDGYRRANKAWADAGRRGDAPADPVVNYVGKNLFKHYGCFGCHHIEEYKNATPIGAEVTEWGSKILERLEFNHAPIDHTHFDFAYAKMRNPRIFDHGMPRMDKPYERLKMPRFVFSTDEAFDLATFLISLVNDPIPAASMFAPDDRQTAIIRGRQVIARYNCQACHVIEGQGGDIWPVIDQEKWRPPDLLGQGFKTQPAWLFEYLKNPAFVTAYGPDGSDRVRPWHSLRMPTFGFTDEEARAVVHYFSALSRQTWTFETAEEDSLDSKRFANAKTVKIKEENFVARNTIEEARGLFQDLACKSCHSTDAAIATQAPNFLHSRAGRLRKEWVKSWLWDPSKLQPGTSMPNFYINADGDLKMQSPGWFDADHDKQIRSLSDYIRHHYSEKDR